MKKYKLELTLTEPMLGTVPYSPEVYKRFIESKKPKGVKEKESKTIEEREKGGWTGFHKDEKSGELFIYDYMIKGFLKAAAGALKKKGETAGKSLIDQVVFVFPRRIMLGMKKAEGILERPLRAQTPMGPRVTVARSDYVDMGTKIVCEIRVLSEHRMSTKRLEELLDYGEYSGLGQFRNGSYGRFDYKLTEM